jgi:hypothetical protein
MQTISGGCKQFLGDANNFWGMQTISGGVCTWGHKRGTTELFSKISKPIPNFLKFAENHFFHQNNGI